MVVKHHNIHYTQDIFCFHSMVESKQACYKVSMWQSALEEIYRHHPSAKLAYTGRLDIDDFTSVLTFTLIKNSLI